MAGDWIKMRVDLADDPAVIGMASSLGIDEDSIVGKLHRVWSWADKHTISGTTNGVTAAWLDRFVACKGFADAMRKALWLVIDDDSITFPHFDRHNGKPAKARAEAAIRQRLFRHERNAGVTGLSRVVTPAPFVRKVISRDGGLCAYCGHAGDVHNKLGVDHIIPQTRGGKDAIENLVTCCSLCNTEKNDRTPEEWGMPLKFLPDGVTYSSQKICDTRVTPALPEKRREESKPPIPPSGDFELFWKSYPRKDAKKKAEQAFNKLRLANGDFEHMLAALESAKKTDQWRKSDGEFIPHAATWLNQRRFEDEGTAPVKPRVDC